MTWQDLRISTRGLLRAPGFALTSTLTLALAVGMATSIFSVVNALLLRPLAYKDPARLAMIWTVFQDDNRANVSFDDFEDWMRNSKTIESGAAYTTFSHPIYSHGGRAERLSALLISHGYFGVMKVKPLLGRFFLPAEDRDGRDYVVVLSYDYWRTQFHSDPGVIGRSILLNAHPQTIVGVAGPDLLPLPPSIEEVPPQIYRPVGERFDPGSRSGRHLETLVRLKPNVSIAQAQAELNVRCHEMQRVNKADDQLAARIVSLRDDMVRNVRAPLLALQGAVLVLMLIACANIANLLLAKSNGRRRELAVRAALGANTARLARLLLSESLVLGIAGCVCGLLFALWSTAALTAVAAQVLPDAASIGIDLRVLVFSIGLSLIASVLFGIAPVFRLSSSSPEDALKSGTRVAGDRRSRLRQILAATQVALALVLLVSGGLLTKSFLRLRIVSPGFDPKGVLAASVALPEARYPKDAAVIQFFDRTLARLRSLPGVQQAAAVNVVAMSGDFDTTLFKIQGRTSPATEQQYPDRYIVSPGYLQALRIPLRQGRLFDARDDASHPFVCLINETATRLWFPGESPLGKMIRAGGNSTDWDQTPFRQVVGVVGDVAQYGLGLPHTPQIYMPYAQFADRFMTFMVRTGREPGWLASPVREAVFASDPEQPVYDVKPLEAIVSNTIAARRLGLALLVAFALAALSLAAIGIYGVVSYSVAQRTSEFGIRLALGADSANIIRTALRDSIFMVLTGLVTGVAVSLGVSKLLARFLFEIRPTDLTVFASLPMLLAMIAFLACYMPARRAANVDPVTALRHE